MTTDTSVIKAVPIEERSPLVEALHRRLNAAEEEITRLRAALIDVRETKRHIGVAREIAKRALEVRP